MKHLVFFNELNQYQNNQKNMAFIASNSAAGSLGKEASAPGPTPVKMKQSLYDRAISFMKKGKTTNNVKKKSDRGKGRKNNVF